MHQFSCSSALFTMQNCHKRRRCATWLGASHPSELHFIIVIFRWYSRIDTSLSKCLVYLILTLISPHFRHGPLRVSRTCSILLIIDSLMCLSTKKKQYSNVDLIRIYLNNFQNISIHD